MEFEFVTESILIGIGLAMDAFSVSLANGLRDCKMKAGTAIGMASIFAAFQFIMPVIGWILISTVSNKFQVFEKMIPWIAFFLLLYIGGKMFAEGIKEIKKKSQDAEEFLRCSVKKLPISEIAIQGVATSLDALSVGFTTVGYGFARMIASSLIIGAVTFLICGTGIVIGKKFGTGLKGKASVFGGILLIAIGTKILFGM